MTDRRVEWLAGYLKPLLGCVVTHVAAFPDAEGFGAWPTITLAHPDGHIFTLEVSQDEEGNGPGFLFGLPSVSFDESGVLRYAAEEGEDGQAV